MDVRETYAMLARQLTRAGVASPQAEAWQLLEAATGNRRSELLTDSRILTGLEQRKLGEWLGRRSLREPLQLILGSTNFYGLDLQVEPGVLIPRPETERLVELTLAAVESISAPRLLDMGTGTGAVALALKAERPDAVVMATDISTAALDLALRNCEALDSDIELLHSDLLEAPRVAEFVRSAHAVVANPPYLPESGDSVVDPEVRWDPHDALYAGDDGLNVFRQLAEQARTLLSPGALLLVELDPRNVQQARAEVATEWAHAQVHADLVGRERFLELRR